MTLVPAAKPRLSEDDVLKIIEKQGVNLSVCKVALLGIRGYYMNSMGEKNKNDRGIYDDALIWVVKDRGIMAFNGNCDPSKYRKGWGFGQEKGMASLMPGVWFYKTGMHNGKIPHPAFRQYAPVIVLRDTENGSYQDGPGHFGINIHRGGSSGTSSLGCQTVPPAQWPAFKEVGYSAIKEYGLEKFPYILVEEKTT